MSFKFQRYWAPDPDDNSWDPDATWGGQDKEQSRATGNIEPSKVQDEKPEPAHKDPRKASLGNGEGKEPHQHNHAAVKAVQGVAPHLWHKHKASQDIVQKKDIQSSSENVAPAAPAVAVSVANPIPPAPVTAATPWAPIPRERASNSPALLTETNDQGHPTAEPHKSQGYSGPSPPMVPQPPRGRHPHADRSAYASRPNAEIHSGSPSRPARSTRRGRGRYRGSHREGPPKSRNQPAGEQVQGWFAPASRAVTNAAARRNSPNQAPPQNRPASEEEVSYQPPGRENFQDANKAVEQPQATGWFTPEGSEHNYRPSGNGNAQDAEKAVERPQATGWFTPERVRPFDLTRFGAVRANPDTDTSSPRHLSDISTPVFSDHGPPHEVGQPTKDIRNVIAQGHRIEGYGGNWAEPDWFCSTRWDGSLENASYLDKFIIGWTRDLPTDVRADFLEDDVPRHWARDIDTYTGDLLPPVIYPDTSLNPEEVELKNYWRRQNWNSNLILRRELMRLGLAEDMDIPRPPRGIHWPTEPVEVTQAIKYIKPYKPEPHPAAPRVPCHMRPARIEDMEGVRAIYNLEVQSGLQASDTEALTLEDFHNIFEMTQKLQMPFVVMISGRYRKKDKGKGKAAGARYQGYQDQEEDQPPRQVLAFGYLSVWEQGLAGSWHTRSMTTARAHVFVHPEYRRKKLGQACLDKIMTTVSYRHSTIGGYDFIDPTENQLYTFARNHDRKYGQVYLHYYVKTSKEVNHTDLKNFVKDLEWLEKYFDKFRFRKIAHLPACHQTQKGQPSGEPFYLNAVIFHHICPPAGEFVVGL